MACPLPCMRLEPEKRNEKVRCSAGMHVVRPPCSWSWPRGRIIVVTPHHPPRPRSPVVRPRLRIVAVKGHDFLLNLCLLPRYVNVWSHGCRSWSQCDRKILTGKYNNTIEPEAEFLSEIRPSVVPEAKPRALREV